MIAELIKTKLVLQNAKGFYVQRYQVTVAGPFGTREEAERYIKGILKSYPERSYMEYGIVSNSKQNEKGWPDFYQCNFLEAGICNYEDVGQGVALLKKEAIDTWIQTFKGKPVIIQHQEVGPGNYKEVAVGYITSVWFDASDGWYHCEFIIDKDEGHETIAKGFSVSCSFDVVSSLPGGEWHASKYTEEITEGAGLHLALVETPRYEDCRISKANNKVRWNSKDTKINRSLGAVCSYCGKDMTEEEISSGTPKCHPKASVVDESEYRGSKSNEATEECDKCHKKISKKEKEDYEGLCSGCWESERVIDKKENTMKLDLRSNVAKINSELELMTPLAMDKYFESLSDVGVQTIIDGEYKAEIKEVAKKHLGDRAKKKEEELLSTSGKKEDSKMFKLFGKKSAVKDNKIDTDLISVDVDGEQVPLSTLMNSLSNEGDEKIEVLHEADSVKVNGKDVKIGDLVTAYKNAKAKKNGEEEKCNKCGEKKHEGECDPEKKYAFEKVKEDAKKNADEELKKKEEENKKNAEEIEKKKEEEEEAKKNAKAKQDAEDRHFLELANAKNQAAENVGAAGAETREDRARRGKKLFGKNKK